MGQARILVVDDEKFFREAIKDVLSQADLECVMAASGEEALEHATDDGIAAAILDLQLPDLHGLEVFRRLSVRRPNLPVIILSAHTDQENVLEALRLGAFDYLAKPLHEEELTLAVRRALQNWEIASGWTGLRACLRRLEASLENVSALEWRGEGGDTGQLESTVVQAVAEVLGASKTSLMLLDEKAAELRVVAAVGRKLPVEQMDRVLVGEGVSGGVLARSEPLLVTDVAADERFAGLAGGNRYDSTSFVLAPLVAGGSTFGVVCATDRPGNRPFAEEDSSLLRILALGVAPLLQASRDPAPAAQAGNASATDSGIGLELARAICEAVTAEVEPARVLEAALRPVAERLGAAPVSLFLKTPGGELQREAECDRGARSDRSRLPTGSGLAGIVLESGALIASDRPQDDPRFDAQVDTPADGRAGPLLCGPLRFRGKTLGLFRAFPEAAEGASAGLGEVLSAALSAALRNVMLYRSLVETIEEVAQARREVRVR